MCFSKSAAVMASAAAFGTDGASAAKARAVRLPALRTTNLSFIWVRLYRARAAVHASSSVAVALRATLALRFKSISLRTAKRLQKNGQEARLVLRAVERQDSLGDATIPREISSRVHPALCCDRSDRARRDLSRTGRSRAREAAARRRNAGVDHQPRGLDWLHLSR